MQLADFQDAFVAALLNPNVSENELERIRFLPASPILTKQIDVYRSQFLKGLRNILIEAYPTIHSIMGDLNFKSVSDEYFLQSVPKNIDPVLICENFASFIDDMEHDNEQPYLADLATVDLGCFQAKNAIDAEAEDKKIFTELSPEELAKRKIQLHPACYWLSSPYAIYDIWQHYNVQSNDNNFVKDTPQELIILRSGSNIRVYKATAGLVKTLDALDAGDAINTALQKGSAVDPKLDPMSTMQFLIHNNLVTSLY